MASPNTAATVTTYNAKVGRVKGGDEFYVKETGLFSFFTHTMSGQEMLLFLLGRLTVTQHGSASFTAGSVLSPAYGMHVFSAATGMSKGSFTMPAASYGAWIHLNGSYLVGDANQSVRTDSTTGLVLNTRGSDLSSFEISAAGQLVAVCLTDGTWQVMEENINEHPSS